MPSQTENFVDLHFPYAGMDTGSTFDRQPNRAVGSDGQYGRTSPLAVNVRAFEPLTDRMRGGSRPGLKRYLQRQINAASIQDITSIVIAKSSLASGGIIFPVEEEEHRGEDAPAGDTMRSTRLLIPLTVSGGALYRFDFSTRVLVDAAFLSSTASVVYGQPIGLKVYYVDGASYKTYDPTSDTTASVTATAGSLPSGSGGEKCRLSCLWRGRWVLSGLRTDSQNWFMSKVDAPTDFDYSPLSPSAVQAVAGNNSQAGLVGDQINCLIPYSDDVLIFGGDHTIWQATGDPADGGRIDRISDTIGMAWGRPFCRGPDGTLFFFSSRGAVYAMQPGSQPVRVSQAISNELASVDVKFSLIRMAWDDAAQGIHLFITPLTRGESGVHWFMESRSGGWFRVDFAEPDHQPKAVYVLDGDAAADRVVLLGSWDGHIRHFDSAADTDDGVAIASEVVIGPFLTPDTDAMSLNSVQAILGESSGKVTYEVLVGRTAEAALLSEPKVTGVWKGGRSLNKHSRRSGHAIYVRLRSTDRWAMEEVKVGVLTRGRLQKRRV